VLINTHVQKFGGRGGDHGGLDTHSQWVLCGRTL